MNLKSLPESERPRERLARYGAEFLSTPEILAILLGSGTKNRSVLELAQDLLSHFGSLRALSEASLQELKALKGIGVAKAVQLQAAFALFVRIEEKERAPLLDTAKSMYEIVRKDLEKQKTEMLLVVLCDAKRRLIHQEIVTKGILTETLCHPREVFHAAIRHRAHSIVIAHNHPSGDPRPSPKDLEVTTILHKAGRVIGIELLDHLIIGSDAYVSLRESGFFVDSL